MLEADAAGDHAKFAGAFDPFDEFTFFIEFFEFVQRGAQILMGDPGVSRNHHVAPGIVGEAAGFRLRDPAAPFEDALGVADAGGDPEQHRAAVRFGELKGADQEVIALLRIRRLQHRHPGRDRIAAVVLFILAGGHAGIVGADDHQPAGRAGVGDRKERVGGDVEPDMFHRDQRTAVRKSDADADFESGLFVRSPLGGAALLAEFVEDLRRRRAGITDAEVYAAVESGHRDGLIAARKYSLSHIVSPYRVLIAHLW